MCLWKRKKYQILKGWEQNSKHFWLTFYYHWKNDDDVLLRCKFTKLGTKWQLEKKFTLNVPVYFAQELVELKKFEKLSRKLFWQFQRKTLNITIEMIFRLYTEWPSSWKHLRRKPKNITTIDAVPSNCDRTDGSTVNGTRKSVQISFSHDASEVLLTFRRTYVDFLKEGNEKR